MPRVNTTELTQVGTQVTALADRIHAATAAVTPPGAGGDGFLTTESAVRFWTGVRPAVLAGGARVARFGDDLTASAQHWDQIDQAHAALFTPGAGPTPGAAAAPPAGGVPTPPAGR
jgi:hypothetical protein